MEKEFIPYQQALALKELGFNEPCMARFSLGLEKHNTTQLQFVLDHSLDKGTNIPIENDFFPTSCYNKGMYIPTAPLYQQAFRWFREKHNLHPNIISTNMWTTFSFTIDDIQNKNCIATHLDFTRCEEAELACLIKLIEIVKDSK